MTELAVLVVAAIVGYIVRRIREVDETKAWLIGGAVVAVFLAIATMFAKFLPASPRLYHIAARAGWIFVLFGAVASRIGVFFASSMAARGNRSIDSPQNFSNAPTAATAAIVPRQTIDGQIQTPARLRTYLIVLVLGAYLLSFFLPAVYRAEFGSGEFHSRGGPVPGWLAFVFGALMMFSGCPAWLANPALCVAILRLRRGRTSAALIAALIAACVAPTIFLFQDTSVSFHPLVGIVVWIGSMVAFAAGTALLLFLEAPLEKRTQRMLANEPLVDEWQQVVENYRHQQNDEDPGPSK